MLLSMPQLTDPNFSRTVVLLCKHSTEGGAFGFVVNRPLLTSGPVVVEVRTEGLDAAAQKTREMSGHELQVWVGGPVDPQRTLILVGRGHDSLEAECGMRIADGLALSTSPDLLHRLLGSAPPSRARLIVGYAGWSPGQLEAELESSAWLISEVSHDLIFSTPADAMWETAIRRLGADPAALQASKGIH
jgi:putative transcriptional regulator